MPTGGAYGRAQHQVPADAEDVQGLLREGPGSKKMRDDGAVWVS